MAAWGLRMRVLLVGVEMGHADTIRTMLRREFYAPSVVEVPSGEACACAVVELEPDLVLVGPRLFDMTRSRLRDRLQQFGHEGLFGVIVSDLQMAPVDTDLVLPSGFGRRSARRVFERTGLLPSRRARVAKRAA